MTRGRKVTLEITLETVENNWYSRKNRTRRTFGREVTQESNIYSDI